MKTQIKLIVKNRPRTKLFPKGAVLHETATPGASAENEYKYFNNNNVGASAHGFVDWNGYIQTIPYNEVAWHAGPTANSGYIGIEMCHAKSKSDFNKVWNNTVELFAELFKTYGWDVNDTTLMTHKQVSLKWGETDHTDPIGYFNKFGKTIDDFRNAVKSKMKGDELTMAQYDELKAMIKEVSDKIKTPMVYNYMDDNMPAFAKPTIQKLMDKGYLKGESGGLNLTYDMLRILVILDRSNAFDK